MEILSKFPWTVYYIFQAIPEREREKEKEVFTEELN